MHFILQRRTDYLVETSKMLEFSRTEFLGLSVVAALDLRLGGIDARIWKKFRKLTDILYFRLNSCKESNLPFSFKIS